MIVLFALRKARAEGTELTFDQYTWASKAIINSDNDSADALWECGGKDAYTALAADLGLAHTRGDERSEFWSWTVRRLRRPAGPRRRPRRRVARRSLSTTGSTCWT